MSKPGDWQVGRPGDGQAGRWARSQRSRAKERRKVDWQEHRAEKRWGLVVVVEHKHRNIECVGLALETLAQCNHR